MQDLMSLESNHQRLWTYFMCIFCITHFFLYLHSYDLSLNEGYNFKMLLLVSQMYQEKVWITQTVIAEKTVV